MKNKFTIILASMFAGAIIGAAIFWLVCNCCCSTKECTRTCGPTADSTGIHRISAQTSAGFRQTYLKTPFSVDTLIAFTINFEQFNAMKLIAGGDSSVHGFRIYMGMDKSTPVRMVVGTGSPDHSDVIYVTSDVKSGPCPRVCDDSNDDRIQ